MTAPPKFAILLSLVWLCGSAAIGWQVARNSHEGWLGLLVAALIGAAGLFAVTAILLLRQITTEEKERLQTLSQQWQSAQQSFQELLRQRDQLSLLVHLMQQLVSITHPKELLTVLLRELGLFFNAERAEGVVFNEGVLYGTWQRPDGKVSLQVWETPPVRPLRAWMDLTHPPALSSNEAVIPVRSEGTVMAILYLVRSVPFTAEDRRFLEVVAAQVALALGYLRFITALKTLSITDPLTGIANRRYWDWRLSEEIARAQRYRYPLALLMVDIDRFKRVNDTYGHQVGDVVLQQVAQRLRSNLRRTDFLARYGGEELSVLAPQTSLEAATVLAERLRRAIANEPIIVNNDSAIPLTISIGVAVFPDHAQNESDLVAAADAALYRAKQDGGNCVRVAEVSIA